MQVTTATSDALQKYLDLASDQMKLTAANMANVDTPGYKTQGFDFAQELSRALGTSASSAKAQLEFRAGVSLLRSQYTRVMDAIHADSK